MTAPNIIFIMSDDHAAHAISAYGSRVNTTPQMDRIADEGVRMDAVYCTNSVCSPSRATILTGTYSHINGVGSIRTEIDYRVPTFIDALKQHSDYRTGLYGKWHLGEGASAPRNFDEWQVLPGQGDYVDPRMVTPSGDVETHGYVTDIITDLAIDFIDRRREDEPFCLLVHHKAPHRPWIPDDKHLDLYADGSIPEPESFLDDMSGHCAAIGRVRMSIADHMGAPYDLKQELPEELKGPENRLARLRWKYQIYMRDYLQVVQSIDDNIGRLLDHLDATGLADNTLVVYTSDQGFFLGDHGWFDKRLMFDESLMMPMLVRWPAAIPAGGRCEAMVTNVDFAATLLEAAGLSADAVLPTSQGRSFLPVLRGEQVDDWPDAIYYRYWEHDDPDHHAPGHYGVRTATHKLIHYYGAGLGTPGASDAIFEPEWELYDLVEDPFELNNVAELPEYAAVRAELELRLRQLQDHYGDLPYAGPDTPQPEWGPYDAVSLAGAQAHADAIEATA